MIETNKYSFSQFPIGLELEQHFRNTQSLQARKRNERKLVELEYGTTLANTFFREIRIAKKQNETETENELSLLT